MKNTPLKQKFKSINFVKPLYKVTKHNPQSISVNIDNANLCGDGIWIKRKVFHDKSVDFDLTSIRHRNSGYRSLPGTCEKYRCSDINKSMHDKELFSAKINRLDHMSNLIENNNEIQENKLDKSVQTNRKYDCSQKIPSRWLRVFPAAQMKGESLWSMIFRCFICQLGLASFLVVWTLLWVFIINIFEEPHEHIVTEEFEKLQNQLVIELATELRQITPLSPRWKDSIEKRMSDERRLTLQAVGRGALLHPGHYWNHAGTFLFTVYVMTALERRMSDERRLTLQAVGRGALLHPGHYWNHAGTFLFTVYVMTALGFGAPVPQTLWGRSAALMYAVLAVPIHIYLMVNLSTCIVCKVGRIIKANKMAVNLNQTESITNKNTGSPTCSRISEDKKTKSFRERIIHSSKYLCIGRCIPLAAVVYYSVGAIAFGVLRGKKGMEVAMFPLEFTINGGLEHVEEHVRFLYAFYVEGAMTLIACVVSTIRERSAAAAHEVADHYKLFAYDVDDMES